VNGETYTAAKEKEIEGSDSDRTELLCHTWKAKVSEEDKEEGFIELTETFSKSGTYVSYTKYYTSSTNGKWDPNSIEEDYSSGIWKWNNKEQTEITVRNNEILDGDDDIYEEEVLKILELNSKSMKIEAMEYYSSASSSDVETGKTTETSGYEVVVYEYYR
jgi:hypothetical protein